MGEGEHIKGGGGQRHLEQMMDLHSKMETWSKEAAGHRVAAADTGPKQQRKTVFRCHRSAINKKLFARNLWASF